MAKRVYIYQTQTFFADGGYEYGCGVGESDIRVYKKFNDAKLDATSDFDALASTRNVMYSGSISEPDRRLDSEDLGGYSMSFEAMVKGVATLYRVVCHIYKKRLC